MTGWETQLITPLEQLAELSHTAPLDSVIVGGGTAGITTARTLIEAGKRVAILEAGPIVLLTHATTTDLRFDRTLLRAVRQTVDYSPKLAGGTTFGTLVGCLGGRGMFWNGASPRYRDADFANWPISAADLASYYEWAEREFRVSRDFGGGTLGQTVCRLLRRAGFPAEPGPFAIDTRATRDGWIGGTVANAVASLLRTGMLSDANKPLRISTGSFAQQILFDSSSKQARGIVAVDRASKGQYEILAKSVVLAAGALESARLALASNLPDASGLIGRRVTDHLFCRAYYNVPPELYDSARPEAAIAFVPSSDSRKYQLEIHLPGNNLFTLRDDRPWAPARNGDYAAMIRSFGPVLSNPENHIELDGDGPGGYVVHFAYAPQDLALRDEMRAAINAVRVTLGGDDAQITTLDPGASFHEAGGLIMGEDAATSVTDPAGRFHQISNLMAADAATWPAISASNPHLTIAAMARRKAVLLSQRL